MVIIGLGNMGERYEGTYHNVGFMTVDALASKMNAQFKRREFSAVVAKKYVQGVPMILAKPTTFMNLSGESVRKFVGKYGKENVIIVFDDIELPVGKVRVRKSGSGGTHNGMKSIVEYTGEDIARIRIGIGHSEVEEMELADYVLSKMTGEKLDLVKAAVDRVANELARYMAGSIDFDRLTAELNTVV